ncbi:methyltransferase domain-containing protein [Myxococcota bacterium]|nr:methyltransferase domain-containing protein [Myxococcota bacterium]
MSQEETRPNQHAWSDVDKAPDTQAFAAYLDTLRGLDAIAEYKRRSIERLRLKPGQRVLDLGCGTGDDTALLAAAVGPAGGALGVDFSGAMVDESRRRWLNKGLPLSFEVGDVHKLDLPNDHFDGVRADRVFQHLAQPTDALAELVRVTRPGGRVVVSDPDWGTYILDAPPTPAVLKYHDLAQRQAKNPWIGRQLYGMFRALGLVELEVTVSVTTFTDLNVLERLGNLDAGFITAVQTGQLTEAEVGAVKRVLRERQDAGRFFGSVNIYTISGALPEAVSAP